MINHTDLLNYVAKRIHAKSYLEIGTQECKNYRAIEVEHKTGVDPCPIKWDTGVHRQTSDDFFVRCYDVHGKPWMFDLIFIDGLHEAEQVKRDIENAWMFLNDGGVIIIHDCNPHTREIAQYPRTTKEWCGNVWATVSTITSPRFTIDFDYGCMVLRKKDGLQIGYPLDNWNDFDKNRKELLNLVSVDEAIKIIDQWI